MPDPDWIQRGALEGRRAQAEAAYQRLEAEVREQLGHLDRYCFGCCAGLLSGIWRQVSYLHS